MGDAVDHGPDGPAFLNPRDAGALEALVSGGFVCGAGAEARMHSLSRLLSLLDGPVPDETAQNRALLIDLTAARCARAGVDRASLARLGNADGRALSVADAAALDELVEAQWDAARVSEANRPAAERLAALMGATHASGDEVSDSQRRDLIERTLLHVQRGVDESALRMRPTREELAPEVRTPGFRLRDLIAVAAMLLIGVSVMWPVLVNARLRAQLASCGMDLGQAAQGFGAYAFDNAGAMPAAHASLLSGDNIFSTQWWNVGDEKSSHSANVYLLVEMQYVPIEHLACPGNFFAPTEAQPGRHDWSTPEQVSYSYALSSNRTRLLTALPTFVVLADKSPVIDRARLGERPEAHADSPNHSGRGQHVLHADGSVFRLASPVLESGDNIWLPRSHEVDPYLVLTGREAPADDRDAFVGP